MTKRRAEQELAAAEFVRALTHKSEPVPEWVLAPEPPAGQRDQAPRPALPAEPVARVEPGELNPNASSATPSSTARSSRR